MHDFLLAKEIIDQLKQVVGQSKLSKVKKVYIEIGSVAMAHDGYPEHTEDVSVENLLFGLENIAKGTPLKKARFFVEKVAGDNWKIVDIEV